MDSLTHPGNGRLLLLAGRGAARLAAARVKASPKVALGAALAALVVGIGANALLFQGGPEAPVVSGLATNAPSAMAVEPVAAHAPPPATVAPRPEPTAPTTTASLGPAAGNDRLAPKRAERRTSAPRQQDLIGAFLSGMSADNAARPAETAKADASRPHHGPSRREKRQ